MHHLHPRSRTTSTLFTTTLAVSFLVVALPHLLPCPVDRRQFADTIEMPDGTKRRRRRPVDSENSPGQSQSAEVVDDLRDQSEKRKRECPVPKPGGLVGQMMGFEQKSEKGKPLEVMVKSFRAQSTSPRSENSDDAP